MAYTPYVWHDGDTGGTLVTAARLNTLEQGVGQVPELYAPAPSGGDDTAALQPLLTQAQTSGGTLILRAGSYTANLATAQSFLQPKIIGQGKNYTTLTGAVNTKPVLRFKGGSGAMSGGYVADLTLTGTGGVGFEIADAGGVRFERLAFGGTLAEGLTFHSENTNAFCEFNHGDAEFGSSVVLPVRYKRTGGNESFHGTGLTVGTIFNQTSATAGPMIQIDSGCFPYNAPLTARFFTRAAGVPLIRNNSNQRSPYSAQFSGNITVENAVTGAVLVDTASVQTVLFSGPINVLGSTSFTVGALQSASYTYFNDTGITVRATAVIGTQPTSITSKGQLGQMGTDGTYLYVCIAQDSWRRVALGTW